MTGASNGTGEYLAEDKLTPIVDTVRATALELIAALPERPERLRVQAAGVVVDLDWRSQPVPVAALPQAAQAPQAIEAGRINSPVVAAVTVEAPVQVTVESKSKSHFVCAPAIGVFYHAPEPGKPPFVEIGGRVAIGQQVGIIEAMKLMMPVEAERTGQVIRVLVADGQPVQYGEPLIELEAE